jgi:phage baseplate assembly protein W
MIDSGTLLGRGIRFPPDVVDGRIAWSEGSANIRESIEIILRTERQERLLSPEFGGGLGPLLFEANEAVTHHRLEERIGRALQLWEPRIAVESVTVDADPDDPAAATAVVVYKLVATQTRQRIDLTVALAA